MKRFFLLMALAIFSLLAFLGSRGLNEPDEGRYAEIAREMSVSGDWLIPHLNGFPHFQKPPMIYWATAASLELFGTNEWAARLPSALAAVGTLALTWWIGVLLIGESAALIASLALLSSIGFFALARVLTPDMTMTFWILAAIACFVRYATRATQRRWIWLTFAAMGAGFLTKGPMALVVPLSAIGAWQIASLGTPERVRVPWVRGLTLSLLFGLSWFIVLAVWRHDLFEYFWRDELLERFSSSKHGRRRPFWFFLLVLPIAFLPWTFLLPSIMRGSWREWQARNLSSAQWLLLGWVVVPFVILSISGSKLPTYVLPLLPALALAVGGWVWRKREFSRWVTVLTSSSLIILLSIAALAPLFNDYFAQQATVRELARTVREDSTLRDARIYAFDVRAHGFEFYLGRLVGATRQSSDIVLPTSPEEEKRLISSKRFDASTIFPAVGKPPVVVLVRSDRVGSTFPETEWRPLGRAGDFVLLRSKPRDIP